MKGSSKETASGAGDLPALMRLPEVEAATCRKKGSIYKGINAGTFPQPVKLGERAVAWRGADIQGWINARQVAA